MTNFRALRQDLRRQRVEGHALVDPQNTYRPSVRAELRRMFTRPLPVETQTLMCNALLAAIWWYLLPEAWRSWLFSEFKGPAGFALVMVGWMVADVTSTNLMGTMRSMRYAPCAVATRTPCTCLCVRRLLQSV